MVALALTIPVDGTQAGYVIGLRVRALVAQVDRAQDS